MYNILYNIYILFIYLYNIILKCCNFNLYNINFHSEIIIISKRLLSVGGHIPPYNY